jgi:lipopolysaccharide export LptBFGC system permease protein LptF
LATLSAPRDRDLARGIVAEMESIADPIQRSRFARGAVAAMLRLAVRRFGKATVQASGTSAELSGQSGNYGGSTMQLPTTAQLLRRHIAPFAISLLSLTAILLANGTMNRVSDLRARGASAGTIVEVLLVSLPHTAALTIPMAVFFAVAWVFTRLGAEGTLAAAQRRRGGVRRLVVPVVLAAACVAALTLVSNTQILPRANQRLATVLSGGARVLSDRTMTMGELRAAARSARVETGPNAVAHAAAYEVEIQKKYALSAACIILALAAAAIALRFPRGGMSLAVLGGFAVFAAYYFGMITGETLADRRVISPPIAMWMANAVLFSAATVVVWRRRNPPEDDESLEIAR